LAIGLTFNLLQGKILPSTLTYHGFIERRKVMNPVRIHRGHQNNHLGTFIIVIVLLVVLTYLLMQITPLYLRAVSLGG
jgi:hypothetical protein